MHLWEADGPQGDSWLCGLCSLPLISKGEIPHYGRGQRWLYCFNKNNFSFQLYIYIYIFQNTENCFIKKIKPVFKVY